MTDGADAGSVSEVVECFMEKAGFKRGVAAENG